MTARLLAPMAGLALLFASLPVQAGWDRMLDPLTLPPRAQAAALHGPLGQYGPLGQPASPGCTWSRISTPTLQGLRWMLLETCSDLGTQAH
ncbi:MAG TPA: hypothetical protein VMU56_04625 [Beijerinckiaceae bacterium]|nr:hypothetical protein [Beijerinckiaceae bacterium]